MNFKNFMKINENHEIRKFHENSRHENSKQINKNRKIRIFCEIPRHENSMKIYQIQNCENFKKFKISMNIHV